MFDPVSLIVGALVNGLLAGVQASAEEAVVDGYRALRDSITRRYGRGVEVSIEMLETRPDSPQYQAAIAQELRNAGAEEDPELVRLARHLIDLVENPGQNIHSPSATPDPVEQLRRLTGVNAVGQILEEHIRKILSVRSNYKLEDVNLLTANIVHNGDVPQAVREGLAGLHGRIREIIQQIAAHIEEARYREVEHAIANLQAGFAERQRAANLVQADKRMHVSYEALRLTVEFFSELNQGVLARIESEASPQRQSNMMFGNAVMICELTDFVIGYIESFSLGGDLDKLHAEARQRVKETRDRQKALESRLRGMDVEQAVRDQTLEDIRNRESALRELDSEWEKYLGEMQQLRATVNEVRGKIPTLEVIRENAHIQIMTLQLVAMLSFLKQNSDSIRGAVDTLQGFRLAPLSSTRVRRLLGV